MRKTISYFLTILITISLIVSISFIILSNTILNCDFVLQILNQNDYYSLTNIELKNSFEGYIKQSGLDESVFEDVYSKNKLKEDMEIIIRNIYEQEQKKINTDIIQENLQNNIDNYLKDNDISLSTNERNNINTYIKNLINIYDNQVSHPVYLSIAKVGIAKVSNIVYSYSTITYGVFLILFFIIIILNLKNKYNALKYVLISILTSGFFILLTMLIIKLRVNIDSILVLNSNFSLIVTNITKIIIRKFTNIGIILSCVPIIILILCNIKITNGKK